MTSCKRAVFSVVMLVVLAVGLVGCTTEVDYTMGAEFAPTNQNMELKRRVYRLGTMVEGDTESECQLLQTRLYHTDSIVSSNVGSGYFGCEANSTYGKRSAGFMSQMIFSLSLHEERGWGYRPIFDSMMLSLYITDYHGDTTKKHRFNVYEITSNDYFSLREKDNDSVFFINFDPTPYISKEPIFTFEYPDQERGAYVGDISAPTNINVRLEETPATMEYVSRLMFTTAEDLEANDGYALDRDSLYVEGNEKKFVNAIKGVYIAPADDMEGAMFATDLENTALLLYSRSRYKEDPTIIRDTTYMVYNFFLNPGEYEGEAGNVSVNVVDHDFAGVAGYVDGEGVVSSDVLLGYVDGMGGLVTEVKFTDEFLQSLADIAFSEKDAVISINQARLSLYLEGSNYDAQFNPLDMASVMDSSMSRLGLYTDYAHRIAVTDYAYSFESSHKLDFDGYLNRSLANYTMDISTYIQSLILALQSNVDENGKVLFEKFTDEYEPASESLVSYRRFYIAPDAYSMFGFKRQSIYGMDGEVDGQRNIAPIKLELTYTVVR